MSFPDLTLSHWQTTRDALQTYTKIVARVRQKMTPVQRHWYHASLRATAVGLTTTPIPYQHRTFDMEFNFYKHELTIRTSNGDEDVISLDGQSAKDFGEEVIEILSVFDIIAVLDESYYESDDDLTYDDSMVEKYWQATAQIESIFKSFSKGLRQSTGPVQLFPHHFDLAVLWFSGRLVPDQDPEHEEYSDEQMNFGFSTGDGAIPNPYLYATAYPAPEGLTETALPSPAYWQTDGFTGAILPYSALVESDDPHRLLTEYLTTFQTAGQALMLG